MEPLLARQPILDRQERVVAYELLFRGRHSPGAAIVTDDSAATAAVLAGLFTRSAPDQVLGPFSGFINVGEELLHSEVLEILPKDRVVLEILETVPATASTIGRCAALRDQGFSLALDDVVELGDRERAFLPYVGVVKIDLMPLQGGQIDTVAHAFKSWPVKLLAEKVDDRKQVDACQRLGFDLYQGYYFAKPQIVSGRRPDPSKMTLLRIMSMLAREAEVKALEDELKRDAALTYGLLRIVNSAASGLSRRVESVRQAVVVLGRRELSRWVQLLLYATRSNAPDLETNPLLRLAAGRGRLLENLARAMTPHDRELPDRAFMTGVLSLLESLLGAPLHELLEHLVLSDDVRAALLGREGDLGRLLGLAEALEGTDAALLEDHLTRVDALEREDVHLAATEAFNWVNALAKA